MSPLWSLLAIFAVAAGFIALTMWAEKRTRHAGLVSLGGSVLTAAASVFQFWTGGVGLLPVGNALLSVCFLVMYRARRQVALDQARVAPEV